MLIVVLAIAVIGIVVLAVAIITGKTIIALVVIALALVGLLLLARDWMRERPQAVTESREHAEPHDDAGDDSAPEATHEDVAAMEPDRFEPDISDEQPDAAADEQSDASDAADSAVDGNDGAGDVGAGPARQKH
jgi:hypothetical protein